MLLFLAARFTKAIFIMSRLNNETRADRGELFEFLVAVHFVC